MDFLFLLNISQCIQFCNFTDKYQTNNWASSDLWILLQALTNQYFLVAMFISILLWYLLLHQQQDFSYEGFISSVSTIPIHHITLSLRENDFKNQLPAYTDNATNYFQNTTMHTHTNNGDLKSPSFIEFELYSYIHSIINKCRIYSDLKHIELKVNNDIDYISCRIDEEKMTIALQFLLLRIIEMSVSNSCINITISRDENSWILHISNCQKSKSVTNHFIPSFSNILPVYRYGNLQFVKSIIHQHGGEVTGNGHGSIANIQISVPLNYPYQDTQTSEIKHCIMYDTKCSCKAFKDIRTKKNSKTNQRPNVLLVMTDKKFSHYLEKNLSIHFNITVVDTPEQIYTITNHNNYDTIIIDEIVNDMHGDQLCSNIRLDTTTSNIPVILLINTNSDKSYLSYTSSGADILEQRKYSVCKLKADIQMLINNSITRRNRTQQNKSENQTAKTTATDIKTQELSIFINKVEALLEEKLSEKYPIGKLCEDIGMSRTKFSNKMKEATGKNPSRFIFEYKMIRARRLLLSQQHTVSEVSDILGFCNSRYFRRKFKSHYHECPTKYVKKENGLE